MKPRKSDQRFDDGALVRHDFRDAGRRITPHKLAQLRTQILRAIDCALQSRCRDPMLWDLSVESVLSTSDPSRLRVVFRCPDTDQPETDRAKNAEDLLVRLESVRPLIHEEVAQSICRRKVPQLIFELH